MANKKWSTKDWTKTGVDKALKNPDFKQNATSFSKQLEKAAKKHKYGPGPKHMDKD